MTYASTDDDTDGELSVLTANLTGKSDLRLEFVTVPDQAILDCELEVQHRWYGDTAEEIEEAYGPWEDSTVWLSVRGWSGDVVGACRLIAPGPLSQRTVEEASRAPWHLDGDAVTRALGIDVSRAWDVATINVRPELGSAGATVAAALYHGIFVAPDVNGGEWLLAMLDVRVRRLLASVGLVFHPLPGAPPHPYMGSPALQPVYAHLHRLVGDQARYHPQDYERITLGRGLDGLDLPPAQAFRLPAVTVVDLGERAGADN